MCSDTDETVVKTVAATKIRLHVGTRYRSPWYLTLFDPKWARLYVPMDSRELTESTGQTLGWSGRMEDFTVVRSQPSFDVLNISCNECYEYNRLLTLQFCREHPFLTDHFVRF